MKDDIVQIIKTLDSSSLEIGTPSKGGAIKIYFNPDDLEGSKIRLAVALKLRQEAQEAMKD